MQGRVCSVVHIAHCSHQEGLAIDSHRRHFTSAGAALLGAAALLVRFESLDDR